MSAPAHDPDHCQRLAQVFYDMAQLLEAADDSEERVRRVLALLAGVLPFEQCAVLEARLGEDPYVVMVPEASRDDGILLTARLLDLFGHLVDRGASVPAIRAAGNHIAVPLVGLDEVIGLLYVRSSVSEYGEDHVRVLSVVAAKLAGYFTTLRARHELIELAAERDDARRVAEAANLAKDDLLALISRELKLPLDAIVASAQLLREATEDLTARADAMERSAAAADRAHRRLARARAHRAGEPAPVSSPPPDPTDRDRTRD